MKRVAVLFGGPSSEHEVSVNSARNVLDNIDGTLFETLEVFISKNGLFEMNGKSLNITDAIEELKKGSDIVFPVLHGTFGEDGSLQELLETKKIPFVGSGSAASRKAIDKNASNKLFSEHGLSIPQSQILIKDDSISLNFPIVVKPHNEGSSISLYKCQTLDEFETMREKIFSIHTKMLAQEFVSGREFTCGILDIKDSPTALPATEIILKNTALFDYKAKYTSWECTEITPAEVSREIMREIQDIALQCHSILGCKSLSRTDMILKESGIIYVLETNTMPGMTKTSFVPAQAKAYGLDMKQLVTCLLESVSAD